MHIIQTKAFPPVVQRKRSKRIRGTDPADPDPPLVQDTYGVMLLEYHERGSLHKALCKANSENLYFPTRVLWHMFHCRRWIPISCDYFMLRTYPLTRFTPVIQACIAMAYPPKDHLALYNGQQPPYMERIPRRVEEGTFVHFDIDPANGKSLKAMPAASTQGSGLRRNSVSLTLLRDAWPDHKTQC
jgi:hypothetical protein